MIAGFLRYHYPDRAQWVSDQQAMGRFTTVSPAMKFYDQAERKRAKEKQRILKFIGWPYSIPGVEGHDAPRLPAADARRGDMIWRATYESL